MILKGLSFQLKNLSSGGLLLSIMFREHFVSSLLFLAEFMNASHLLH